MPASSSGGCLGSGLFSTCCSKPGKVQDGHGTCRDFDEPVLQTDWPKMIQNGPMNLNLLDHVDTQVHGQICTRLLTTLGHCSGL